MSDADQENKLTTPPQHARVISTEDDRYRLRVTHDYGAPETTLDIVNATRQTDRGNPCEDASTLHTAYWYT